MNLDLGDTRLIIATAERRGLLRNELAYVLATAYLETARTMKPVEEAFWKDDAWRKRNLRYYPWHGRGYVQLTWETNYQKAGRELRMDLTTDPRVVMRPDVAVKILVEGMVEGWFTGKKLSDYITLQKSDYKNARRIINGTDKAQLYADTARDYEAELRRIGYGGAPPTRPDVEPVTAPETPDRRGDTVMGTGILGGAGGAAAAFSQGYEWLGAVLVFAVIVGLIVWMRMK